MQSDNRDLYDWLNDTSRKAHAFDDLVFAIHEYVHNKSVDQGKAGLFAFDFGGVEYQVKADGEFRKFDNPREAIAFLFDKL